MISVAYQESFVEIIAILKNSNKSDINKIPKNLLLFFIQNASSTYTFSVDKNTSIKDMKLKKETRGLLTMLYRNYLSTPEERTEFDVTLRKNQEKHEEILREKYNPDDIFKNTPTKIVPEQETIPVSDDEQLVEYKENFFLRIIQRVKNIFIKAS